MEQPRVLAEEKYPELVKLIQTGKERGFIMYEELFEKLPEEVTGIAEKLDDIYIRLGELEIDDLERPVFEPLARLEHLPFGACGGHEIHETRRHQRRAREMRPATA